MTHPNLRQLVSDISKIPETVDEQLQKMYDTKDALCRKRFKLVLEYKKETDKTKKDYIKQLGISTKASIDAICIEIANFIKLHNIV